jgi:hypothetical protein
MPASLPLDVLELSSEPLTQRAAATRAEFSAPRSVEADRLTGLAMRVAGGG